MGRSILVGLFKQPRDTLLRFICDKYPSPHPQEQPATRCGTVEFYIVFITIHEDEAETNISQFQGLIPNSQTS